MRYQAALRPDCTRSYQVHTLQCAAMTFNTDRIVSLSAMVVGVGSLVTLAYQAGLTRQTQHASVLPYLYISLVANDQNGVSLRPARQSR
jgi:hypothetical protein